MKTSDSLISNDIYTRKQLQEQFQITDANIRNGVFKPKDHDSVWLFVTEQKRNDRTQYSDLLENDTLYWDGQSLGRTDRLIIQHQKLGLELLVFYRKSVEEYPGAGFQFKGIFIYESHTGERPSHFVLRQQQSLETTIKGDLENLRIEEHFEGGKKQYLTNYYERDLKLRIEAIKIHGTQCKVCGFDFGQTYGDLGQDYIEVHHLKPISALDGPTLINPQTDMTVVCSNCHRMLHRKSDYVLSVDELRKIVEAGRS